MSRRQDVLFDAYVAVDWSASTKPKTGADSIWYCVAENGKWKLRIRALRNPATRSAAMREIGGELAGLAERGLKVLAGFDFPIGYPAGFAAALGLDGAPWHAVWEELAGLIVDGDDNRNNRFAVAAELNQRLSGGPFPFWGCPEGQAGPFLSTRKSRRHGPDDLPERRLSDARIHGPQPVWKLYTAGSVGSQALVGIPRLARLRADPRLAGRIRIWPFETGMRPPDCAAGEIIVAEIYPSLFPLTPDGESVKDAAQVRNVVRHLAAADNAGELAAKFTGPPALTETERRRIETEEAWILGVS